MNGVCPPCFSGGRGGQRELLAASISQVTFQKRCKSIRHRFHAWSPIRCILLDGHTKHLVFRRLFDFI